MKLQYKNQQFQLDAVEAITSIFEGQPRQTSMSYMMDIGKEKNITADIEYIANKKLLIIPTLYKTVIGYRLIE